MTNESATPQVGQGSDILTALLEKLKLLLLRERKLTTLQQTHQHHRGKARAFLGTKPQSGTGIGLGMAFKLVTLYERTIELSTAVGRGTTFRVEIPTFTQQRQTERLEETNSGSREFGGTRVPG